MIRHFVDEIKVDGLLPTIDEVTRRMSDSGWDRDEVEACLKLIVDDPTPFSIVTAKDAADHMRDPLKTHTQTAHESLSEVARLRETISAFHTSNRKRRNSGGDRFMV
jgi:hypothetical protein